MDKATIHTIVQAVSIFSMTGGLFYAAVQFRGWRAAQQVANVTKLIELQLELRKMMVDDPTLAPISISNKVDCSKEETRAYYYNLMQLSLFEMAWYSHGQGQLSDDYFKSWEANMAHVMKRPAFRAMWTDDQLKIIHPQFLTYVDALFERWKTGDLPSCREGGMPVSGEK